MSADEEPDSGVRAAESVSLADVGQLRYVPVARWIGRLLEGVWLDEIGDRVRS